MELGRELEVPSSNRGKRLGCRRGGDKGTEGSCLQNAPKIEFWDLIASDASRMEKVGEERAEARPEKEKAAA